MHMLVIIVGMTLSQGRAELFGGQPAQDRGGDDEKKESCTHGRI
jgi:hypothetical protein